MKTVVRSHGYSGLNRVVLQVAGAINANTVQTDVRYRMLNSPIQYFRRTINTGHSLLRQQEILVQREQKRQTRIKGTKKFAT